MNAGVQVVVVLTVAGCGSTITASMQIMQGGEVDTLYDFTIKTTFPAKLYYGNK